MIQIKEAGDLFHGAVWALFINENGTVRFEQKISDTEGNFGGVLTDDQFGSAVAELGDLDGNGVTDFVVGAREDNDGGIR